MTFSYHVAVQMLHAVDAIHQQKIVHSDLKPANFLLVRGSIKLIDFGIAKAISNDTTNIHREEQVGTLSYMSPEAIIVDNNITNGKSMIKVRSGEFSRDRMTDDGGMNGLIFPFSWGERAMSGPWDASCIKWCMDLRLFRNSTSIKNCKLSRTPNIRSTTRSTFCPSRKRTPQNVSHPSCWM